MILSSTWMRALDAVKDQRGFGWAQELKWPPSTRYRPSSTRSTLRPSTNTPGSTYPIAFSRKPLPDSSISRRSPARRSSPRRKTTFPSAMIRWDFEPSGSSVSKMSARSSLDADLAHPEVDEAPGLELTLLHLLVRLRPNAQLPGRRRVAIDWRRGLHGRGGRAIAAWTTRLFPGSGPGASVPDRTTRTAAIRRRASDDTDPPRLRPIRRPPCPSRGTRHPRGSPPR